MVVLFPTGARVGKMKPIERVDAGTPDELATLIQQLERLYRLNPGGAVVLGELIARRLLRYEHGR